MQKFSLLLLLLISSSLLIAQNFSLSSTDLKGQSTKKQEFGGFGCNGENVSPQLSWTDVPEGTKSFAITVYDPDAPTGSGFWHWLAFDIPVDITTIPTGAGSTASNLMPANIIQSLTDYGIKGYGGPCPPEGHGIHTYIYTVYALKVPSLGIDSNTNPAVVGFYIWANTIQKASIVSYYSR